MVLSRRVVTASLPGLLCGVGIGPALAQAPAADGGTLRIAMTTGDLPTTGGAPNQGLEGLRFAGYPVFEPLAMWDLRQTQGVPGIIPWLATEWKTDPSDRTKWTFTLRRGVKFHDGSEFDANAVTFNLARFFDRESQQYDPAGAAINASKAPFVARWEKIDHTTVAIYTKVPTTYFTEVVAGILISSPAQYAKAGNSWQAFGQQPSGTGAFRITSVSRNAITMEKNPRYWNTARAAKLGKVVLYSMPEPTTRVAALRSGQVDWVEVPPPDSMPSLTQAGFVVTTSPAPQIWPYWLKIGENTPFKDVRVRQALNYAMDREGLVALLNGGAQPASGFWKQDDPRFGHPKNKYVYDPAKAKALLAQAGWSDRPVPVKVLISTAGSGQMLPQPMNELLQQSAKEAGFDLSFVVVDYAKMLGLRNMPDAPEMRGVVAANYSWTTADMSWFYYAFFPPNWANYDNPEVTALLRQYRADFDLKDPAALLAKVHEKLVDDAPWVWIVHDRNPRAFSSAVSGYTPAQSWFTDLTTITVKS